MQGSDGNFYGTTLLGGASGFGPIFKMAPAGVLMTLVEFATLEEGGPRGGLILGLDGNLYGTTSGPDGSIYRLLFPGSPLVAISRAALQGNVSAIVEAKVNPRGLATNSSSTELTALIFRAPCSSQSI